MAEKTGPSRISVPLAGIWDGAERRSPSEMEPYAKQLGGAFNRVTGTLFTCLLGIAVWVTKTNIDEVKSLSLNQAEITSTLRLLVSQGAESSAGLKMTLEKVSDLQVRMALVESQVGAQSRTLQVATRAARNR